MLTTASMIELTQLLNVSYGDPHHLLGLHEFIHNGRPALVIRVLIPQAKTVSLIAPHDDTNSEAQCRYPLEMVHLDGFFEAIIYDRSKWFRYQLEVEWHDGNNNIMYDPYSFQPVLTSFDLYLFGQGTHYTIFDKLGANCMTIDGIDGVLFAVWAPNAKSVSVIGAFNSWDGRRGQMRLLERSGIWELFVPGIKNFDSYKYEINLFSGQSIQKSDPYAHFAESRPSTSSLVFDIEKYEWNDSKWISKRDKNNPLDQPINVYEAHLSSWRRHENAPLSYIELSETLIPYVKKMGYTHIECMPVMEYPFDGSWGYQITGYYAPTSRYGTPEEFMHFVDCCHQNGIGVILDWVPAHFPKDAHGLAKFDGTPLYEYDDPRKGEHSGWGTLVFNYGRNEVKNFLLANALFWIEKYHIDGLRVDAVASMLYLDYGRLDGNWLPNKYGGRENLDAVELFKHMNSIIRSKYPHVLMIAEESTSWGGVSRSAEKGGLGFNMKWNMGWMNDFLSYMEKETVYRRYHHNNLTFGLVYAYTENFMLVLSHDETVHGKRSLIDKMPGDIWQKCANLRLAYGFMYGHPGKKLLFMGGEFGQFKEWSEECELDWFLLEIEHHKQISEYVKDLNMLYKSERAFWYDDFGGAGFEWIDCNDSERSTVSFIRKTEKPEEMLLFVCNFTNNPIYDHRVGVPYRFVFEEIINSDDKKYGGSGVTNPFSINSVPIETNGRPASISIQLPPLAAAIFRVRKNNT